MAGQPDVTLVLNFAGEGNGVTPRMGRLYCPNNTLSEVATAGFLDNYLTTQNPGLLPTDFIAAVASNGHQWYRPTFSNGSCTLVTLP